MGRRTVSDSSIVALAAANGMVLTVRQLHEAGVGRAQIEARRDRLLVPVVRGVYAVGPVTPEVRLRAVLAAVAGSSASHRTAGRLHGMPLPDGGVAEVVVARRTTVVVPGVRVRWTRSLPAADVTVTGGMRVTTVARTLCDLAGVVSRARVQHLLERAIIEGKLTAGELQACAAGYRRSGRVGSAVLRGLEHDLLDVEPVAGSELERRGMDLLVAAGIEGWVPQYRPPWYDGLRGVVDLAWPGERVVVELDGRRWHATTQAQVEDRRRDRAAVAHGWVVLRFGWQEVVHRPTVVVEECRAMLAARTGQRAGERGVG